MKKLRALSVVGTTAVGKTAFALELAQRILNIGQVKQVALVSADSRQVYQGLEILSGADIPVGFSQVSVQNSSLSYPYFSNPDRQISLHGVACIKPAAEWSAAHFRQLVIEVFNHPNLAGEQAVILVGGTGLYHRVLALAEFSSRPEPDQAIRTQASGMTPVELQNWLNSLAPDQLQKLNQSDRHNTRRLVRAIERVSMSNPDEGALGGQTGLKMRSGLESPSRSEIRSGSAKQSESSATVDLEYIDLWDEWEVIESKIKVRVQERLTTGAVAEVEDFMSRYATPHSSPQSTRQLQAATILGMKEVALLAQGQLTTDQCVELWFRRERSYAKRQLLWWRKYALGERFKVSDPGMMEAAFQRGVDFYSQI
jgi:tRNA dimethylallyltransferase